MRSKRSNNGTSFRMLDHQFLVSGQIDDTTVTALDKLQSIFTFCMAVDAQVQVKYLYVEMSRFIITTVPKLISVHNIHSGHSAEI